MTAFNWQGPQRGTGFRRQSVHCTAMEGREGWLEGREGGEEVKEGTGQKGKGSVGWRVVVRKNVTELIGGEEEGLLDSFLTELHSRKSCMIMC